MWNGIFIVAVVLSILNLFLLFKVAGYVAGVIEVSVILVAVGEVVQSNDNKPNNLEISLYWGTVPIALALAPVES